MAARTVEARLLISGEDRGAAAAIGRVTKAIEGVARAGKVSAEVKRLTDQLNRAGEAARAAERVRAAGNAVASAGMGFKTAEARVKQLSAALDAARAAARQFEGVKALNKSGAIAQEMAQAAARVKDLDTQLKGAQRALKGTASAMNGQVEAARAARSALNAYGVPVTSLEAHQRALKGTIEATTKAIRDQNREAARTSEVKRLAIQRRQEVAAQRAALGDQIAAHRARVLQDTLERREARRDAWKGAAGIVGIGAVHKAEHFGKHALHTYQEFDNERRFGKVVMGLTDDQQKPLVDQAIHMGATTRYNDVQVLEAQRELAARGLNKDQVLGLMSPAADLGQSLDLRLPDAVKQMEGAIFGFKKDISTVAAATASARQTADVQVKAAKISGMTPEDISQTYKYGATSARLSGVSEQTLLAFGGISKKANMGGEEAGVAFRALIANAQSPTQKAREAMLANGLDYKTYQKNPEKLDEAAFTKQVAASYGVELDKNTRAGISKIFSDKALIASPEKFTPAIMDLLSDNLGGDDAKSKKSIAGLANRFRNASMQGVDTNALIVDLMKKLPGNLALANSIFGPKQGNRIANALGDPETLRHMIEELLNHSEGYAAKVSTERMAGFDGAVKRFQGAVTNVETKLGRAWDNDGKGGALTWVADKAGHLVQSFAELDNRVVQATTVVAALGTAFVGVKSIGLLAGGFGLKGSAVALAESAAALNAAAARLGVSGVPGSAAPAAVAGGTLLGPAAVGAGIIMGGSVASVIAKNAVENETFADAYLDNSLLGADPAGYAFGA
ncbi:phage tail tape measure protein, partial [uncultured Methylobacterium sp.]|uniref:phage tail tape measure protein n=1 Tax=uncultured Methylobacterium sp. TaxID=157278 RepID=UPI0035CB824E